MSNADPLGIKSFLSGSPPPHVSDPNDPNEQALNDPRVTEFLDRISRSEGSDYNTLVGGTRIDDLTRHPNKVGLVTEAGPSTAFGRYQITGTTNRSKLKKYLGRDYTARNQDLRAVELLRQKGALDRIMADDPEGAMPLAGGEWASIPGSTLPGRKNAAAWDYGKGKRDPADPLGIHSFIDAQPDEPSAVAPGQAPEPQTTGLSVAQRELMDVGNAARGVPPAPVEKIRGVTEKYMQMVDAGTPGQQQQPPGDLTPPDQQAPAAAPVADNFAKYVNRPDLPQALARDLQWHFGMTDPNDFMRMPVKKQRKMMRMLADATAEDEQKKAQGASLERSRGYQNEMRERVGLGANPEPVNANAMPLATMRDPVTGESFRLHVDNLLTHFPGYDPKTGKISVDTRPLLDENKLRTELRKDAALNVVINRHGWEPGDVSNEELETKARAEGLGPEIDVEHERLVQGVLARAQKLQRAQGREAVDLGFLDRWREVKDKNFVGFVPFVGSVDQIADAVLLQDRVDRFSKGQPTQEDLLVIQELINRQRQKTTLSYDVASIIAEMPAFVGEFVLTGGTYTTGKAAAKVALEASMKQFAKRLASQAGREFLERQVARRAVQLGVKVGTGLVGAAAQTVPAGALRITAGTIERMTPKIEALDVKAGDVKGFSAEPGESFARALRDSATDQYIEIASERAGGLLEHIPLPKRLAAIRDALSARWIKAVPGRTSKQLRSIVERTGWNGVLGEMFEERVGDVAKYATGLQPNLLPSLQQLMAEGIGFSVPGGVNFAANTAVDRLTGRRGETADSGDRTPEPAQPSTPQTPREIIEGAGLQYLGEQQRPKGKPPLHTFNAPDGSTLMLEDVTPETLQAKLEAHDAKRGTVQPPSADTPRMPEAPQTIAAQFDAVGNGERRAVVLEPGTALPPAVSTLDLHYFREGDGPRVFFDSKKITRAEVARLVAEGRIDELIGHVEPVSPKTTRVVVARSGVATGGIKQGDELMSSYVSPGNEGRQQREMQQQFAPLKPTFEAGGTETEARVLGDRATAAKGQPETIVTAAIRSHAGNVITGKNHPQILLSLGREVPKDRSGPEYGFVTSTGRFVSRAEAAQVAGVPNTIAPGQLYTEDLTAVRKAKEAASEQQRPAPLTTTEAKLPSKREAEERTTPASPTKRAIKTLRQRYRTLRNQSDKLFSALVKLDEESSEYENASRKHDQVDKEAQRARLDLEAAEQALKQPVSGRQRRLPTGPLAPVVTNERRQADRRAAERPDAYEVFTPERRAEIQRRIAEAEPGDVEAMATILAGARERVAEDTPERRPTSKEQRRAVRGSPSSEENPVAGFTTSQGSTYTVEGQSTQRTKALHAHHEKTDVGLKEPSERTVYVAPEDATKIGMHTTLNREAQPTVKLTTEGIVLTSKYGREPDGRTYTKTTTETILYSDQPEVGKTPVEFLPRGKVHPGNPIVELRHAEPAPRSTKKQQRRAAAENSQGEPALIELALRDWRDHRAYIDANGNYHVKQGNAASGPIAVWNKEAKHRFRNVSELHRAAHGESAETQESTKKEQRRPVASEPVSNEPRNTADEIKQGADAFGAGAKEAGEARVRELVQQHGYVEYRNPLAIEIFRKDHPEWTEETTADGATRFIPPPSVDSDAHQAATSPQNDLPEPTQAQRDAGNHQMGHTRVAGLDLTVEIPEGGNRTGVDKSGKKWEQRLFSHYGYIKRSEGSDGEQVDVFVKPGTPLDYEGPVFIVNQNDADRNFDEHKVMLGFADTTSARSGYLENYQPGWDRIGSIARMANVAAFKSWLAGGDMAQPAQSQNALQEGEPNAAEAPRKPEVNQETETAADEKAQQTNTQRAKATRDLLSGLLRGWRRRLSSVRQARDVASLEAIVSEMNAHQAEHGLSERLTNALAEFGALLEKVKATQPDTSTATLEAAFDAEFEAMLGVAEPAPPVAAARATRKEQRRTQAFEQALATTVPLKQARKDKRLSKALLSEVNDAVASKDPALAESAAELARAFGATDAEVAAASGKPAAPAVQPAGVKGNALTSEQASKLAALFPTQPDKPDAQFALAEAELQASVYDQVKPYFEAGIQHHRDKTPVAALKALMRELRDVHGFQLDQIAGMKPYPILFVQEFAQLNRLQAEMAGEAEKVPEAAAEPGGVVEAGDNDVEQFADSGDRTPEGWQTAEAGAVEPAPEIRVEDNRVIFTGSQPATLLGKVFKRRVGGVFLRKTGPMELVESLTQMEDPLAHHLAGAVRQAAQGAKAVIITAQGRLVHEMFHESMEGLGVDVATLTKVPAFARARAKLIQKQYPDDPHVLVSEVAAYIAEGKYEEIGLSNAEATAWLTLLFDSVMERNPGITPDRFRELSNVAQEALKAALYRQENETEVHRPEQRTEGLSGRREQRTERPPGFTGIVAATDRQARTALAGYRSRPAASFAGEQDKGTEKLTATPAFKRWFGNSQVLDKKGNPRVVYHKSQAKFTVFDKRRIGHFGFHFGTIEQARQVDTHGARGHLVRAYLRIENPLRLPDLGSWDTDAIVDELAKLRLITPEQDAQLDRAFDPEERLREIIRSHGYDGIVYENLGERKLIDKKRNLLADSYIAFEPTQIKSATENQGTFDPTNPDIRFALEDDPWAEFDELVGSLERDLDDEMRRLSGQRERSLPLTLEAAELEPGENLIYDPESIEGATEAGRQAVTSLGIDESIGKVLHGDPDINWAATGFAILTQLRVKSAGAAESGDAAEAQRLRDRMRKFAEDFAERATKLGQAIAGIRAVEHFAPDRLVYLARKLSKERRGRDLSVEQEERITYLGEELQKMRDRNLALHDRLERAQSEKKERAVTHRTTRSLKPRVSPYQATLNTRAATILQTLKPKVGKLDFGNLGEQFKLKHPKQEGTIGDLTSSPTTPLPGDAELLAEYAASRLHDLRTVADLNDELDREFGAEVRPFLRTIRQRAYTIRQEARAAEMAAKETTSERRSTILSEIRQELAEGEREAREAEQQQQRAEREWQRAADRQDRADARDRAQQTRRQQRREQRQLATEARERRDQARQEYQEARQAETQGWRQTLRDRRRAARRAQLWDTPLRDAAAEARTRLLDHIAAYPDTAAPVTDDTINDLVSVGASMLLPETPGGAARVRSVSPSRVYRDLKREFPGLVSRRNQSRIFQRAFQRVQDTLSAAREAAGMRAANHEVTRLWEEQGIDVDEQAILIQQSELRRQQIENRHALAREFHHVSRSPFRRFVFEVGAFVRAMRSSIDAPLFRQNIINAVAYPIRTARVVVPATWRGYTSDIAMPRDILQFIRNPITTWRVKPWRRGQYQAEVEDLRTHPRYDLSQLAGLDLAELASEGDPEIQADEAFQSTFAEKFPHVRISAQGFVLPMNWSRLDTFARWADRGEVANYTWESNPEFFEQAARVVNAITGRGNMPNSVKRVSGFANVVLYSIRLNIARLQALYHIFTPFAYYSYDPVMCRIVAGLMIRLVFALAGMALVAHMLGFGFSFNPDDDDFFKLKIGHARFDVTGGHAAWVRFMFRFVRGVTMMAAGYDLPPHKDPLKLISLTDQGSFVRQKYAPIPGMAVDFIKRKDVTGQPVTGKGLLWESWQPMVVGDFVDAAMLDGWVGVVKTLPALGGMGVSTYEDNASSLMRDKAKEPAFAPATKEMQRLRGKGFSGEVHTPKQAEGEPDDAYKARTLAETVAALEEVNDTISAQWYKDLKTREEKQTEIKAAIQAGRDKARSEMNFMPPEKPQTQDQPEQ